MAGQSSNETQNHDTIGHIRLQITFYKQWECTAALLMDSRAQVVLGLK